MSLNKIATLLRLGFNCFGYNRILLKVDSHFELRNIQRVLLGWLRINPVLLFKNTVLNSQVGTQIDYFLNKIYYQYCQFLKVQLLTIYLKVFFNTIHIHLFYFYTKSRYFYRSSFLSTQNLLYSFYIFNLRLHLWLRFILKINCFFHNIAFNLYKYLKLIYSLSTLLVKYKKAFLNKNLYLLGTNLLVIIPLFPCNLLMLEWIISCFKFLVKPKTILNILQRAFIFWNVSYPIQYLIGLNLIINGRLFGVDIATKLIIQWGRINKGAITIGVHSFYNEVLTPFGLLGFRLIRNYY